MVLAFNAYTPRPAKACAFKSNSSQASPKGGQVGHGGDRENGGSLRVTPEASKGIDGWRTACQIWPLAFR